MPAYTPEFLFADVSGAGATATFTQEMGQVIVQNAGTDPIFIAVGAVIPAAALGNGVFRIAPNGSLNLNGVAIRQISGISAGVGSMQVAGVPNDVGSPGGL